MPRLNPTPKQSPFDLRLISKLLLTSVMSSACIICHKKKVSYEELPLQARLLLNIPPRCGATLPPTIHAPTVKSPTWSAGKYTCPASSCRLQLIPNCRPYTRKRKRFTNSLSPGRDILSASITLDRRIASQSFSPNVPATGNAVASQPLSLPNNDGEPFIKEESYRGRSEYLPLGGSISFDENMVQPGCEATYAGPKASDVDLQMLREQGAFELPPVSVQKALMNSFKTYCAPWTPIVDTRWLDENAQPSMLLLQAIFLAGSRVSKAHLEYGSSEVFYRRAKLLFFFGGTNNPLISIVAACLLHWYNPVGPEDVSTDTSGFWIRTAGAMAFQIGLHKEPPPSARDRWLRRRLWWSLVVSILLVFSIPLVNLARFAIISSLLALDDRGPSISVTATCFRHHWMTFPSKTSKHTCFWHITRLLGFWVTQSNAICAKRSPDSAKLTWKMPSTDGRSK